MRVPRSSLKTAYVPIGSLRKALPKSKRQCVSPPMPDYIEPQLGTLVSEAPGRGWVHEIKFDGYLIQARIERGQAVLRSRKGLDWSHMFQEIAADCGGLPDCILDGEICAVDADGMPSFAGLQQALSSGKTEKLIYYVFDLIWLAEKDYKPWALSTRKKVRERR